VSSAPKPREVAVKNAVAGFDAVVINRPRSRRTPRRSGRLLRLAAIVTLFAGMLLSRSLPGEATPATGPHCVARLGASLPSLRCFNTLSDAIAAATHGRVHLPQGTTGPQIRDMALIQGAAASNIYVLSVEWTGSNFSGPSLTWEGSSPCGYYANSSMPSGWNDTIRSVAQYSGCATTLYWDINFGGPTYPINVNAQVADLGGFDKNMSSQKWCPAYPCS